MSILILAGLVALAALSSGTCRQSPDRSDRKPAPSSEASTEAKPAEPEELCGECLELPEAAVCTVDGATLRNSCEAICRGARILCNAPCPCPGEEDPADQ